MMYNLLVAAAALLAPHVAHADDGGSVPKPFDGKAMVFRPTIYCVRAPCPPGPYRIVMPGRDTINVSVAAYDPATPDGARTPLSGIAARDGVAIDGVIRFERAADGRLRAIILARRSVPGRWKP